MEALVGTFNKEKAQEGAFSVIVKSSLIFVSTSTQGGAGRPGPGEPQPRAARTQLPAQRGHLLRTCRGQGEGCGHCSSVSCIADIANHIPMDSTDPHLFVNV